jgi:hypothetical protein
MHAPTTADRLLSENRQLREQLAEKAQQANQLLLDLMEAERREKYWRRLAERIHEER